MNPVWSQDAHNNLFGSYRYDPAIAPASIISTSTCTNNRFGNVVGTSNDGDKNTETKCRHNSTYNFLRHGSCATESALDTYVNITFYQHLQKVLPEHHVMREDNDIDTGKLSHIPSGCMNSRKNDKYCPTGQVISSHVRRNKQSAREQFKDLYINSTCTMNRSLVRPVPCGFIDFAEFLTLTGCFYHKNNWNFSSLKLTENTDYRMLLDELGKEPIQYSSERQLVRKSANRMLMNKKWTTQIEIETIRDIDIDIPEPVPYGFIAFAEYFILQCHVNTRIYPNRSCKKGTENKNFITTTPPLDTIAVYETELFVDSEFETIDDEEPSYGEVVIWLETMINALVIFRDLVQSPLWIEGCNRYNR